MYDFNHTHNNEMKNHVKEHNLDENVLKILNCFAVQAHIDSVFTVLLTYGGRGKKMYPLILPL